MDLAQREPELVARVRRRRERRVALGGSAARMAVTPCNLRENILMRRVTTRFVLNDPSRDLEAEPHAWRFLCLGSLREDILV